MGWFEALERSQGITSANRMILGFPFHFLLHLICMDRYLGCQKDLVRIGALHQPCSNPIEVSFSHCLLTILTVKNSFYDCKNLFDAPLWMRIEASSITGIDAKLCYGFIKVWIIAATIVATKKPMTQ